MTPLPFTVAYLDKYHCVEIQNHLLHTYFYHHYPWSFI
jgi:hypothetical protein